MVLLPTPQDMLERLADMRFGPGIDARLQDLMDRNNDGQLNDCERAELAGFVTLNEELSILRAQAMVVLGRKFV